ncbi:hypothetical protein JW988_02915 [Candidatus Bathyarchaeota archaeon]|nr:hypothetical protein [Candidatus Bathyarchaeota archaeon]
MTKHAPDDTLKCHLTVEEPKKLVEENTIAVCSVQTSPEIESTIEVTQITNEIKPIRKGLQKMVPELYNLEDYPESEKTVKIDLDLDLYQMEKV